MFKKIIVVFVVLGLSGLLYYNWSENKKTPVREIPVLGNPDHHIKPFKFINQEGEEFSNNEVKGKVYAVEYFFTTCQSICVPMGRNMMLVDSAFKDRNDFMILSHTVDPEIDSAKVLKEYAKNHQASKNWIFLTGTQKELYTLATESYLLDAPEKVKSPDFFLHTKFFMLVDKKGRLRGDAYDGTNKKSVMKLIEDAKILLTE